ncbi:DUF1697 domain-containing protein [Enterococcus sp. AZ103]|uniref:DUF1697 domain-containing protein n=1 Tax=Enterococcus sp. AZ103 TaxID=2774628 RepID=UPI003F23505E
MEKYIALLRGINVGGKNKIPMPVLKKIFEDANFSSVKTYINSGNIIFSSPMTDKKALIQQIETLIQDEFQLNIPVTIVTATEINDTLKNAPDWWDQADETIHYAIFLIPPITTDEVSAAVGEIIPEYEQIDFGENVIYWSAPRKTFNKARWSKIASSKVNNQVTIRNSNTVKKLMTLCQD